MQKNITKHLLVLILSIGILCSMTVKAEVSSYAGIFDTYTDVRNRYPNAKFEDLEPAWLTPGSRLVSISGSGLGGTIVIHFYDEEYDVKRKLASGDISQAEYSETMRVVSMLKESDSGVRATWVRYVPDNYISLSALTKLYGTPKMEISKSDFSKTASWVRGVDAGLDDKDFVTSVTFHHTALDYVYHNESVCLKDKAKVKGGECKDLQKARQFFEKKYGVRK